jgi:uncharacterized protein with von Willebrand factor type A (vWA) domain
MADEPEDLSWLDAERPAGTEGDGWHVQHGGGVADETPSEYGVKLDKWGQRRGEELIDLPEFKTIKATPEDAADMFGMAFDYDPQLNEQCANQFKTEFLKSLSENDEFQALRGQTRLDNMASELAALKFEQEFTVYAERRKKEKPQPSSGDPHKDAKEKLRQEMKTAAACGKAVQQAAQEVQDLNDARSALGIGSEAGSMQGMSPTEVKKMFHRIKNNVGLRNMLDLAGRYRLAARAKQRIKVKHGYDDMIGLTIDGDISRLVPSELAVLGHPVLRVDAIRRLVERQMTCRLYRGVENVAKGPIIVIIDESGSMSGPRIANAKALALAMAWVAKHQRRWCGFIGFSGRGQVRSLALPPDKWPADSVLKWLESFFNGGTELPVREIPDLYDKMGAPKGKTDLICITDGDTGPIADGDRKQFLAWKKRAECKFIGITIASPAQILQSISDEFYRIPALSPDNEAVERVLSV